MLFIGGLIVVLVAVTVVLTLLTSAGGTHDGFAVLGQRAGGHVVPVRDRGRGVGMAERIDGRRAAPATPGVAGTDYGVPPLNSLKRVYHRLKNPEMRSR